MGTLNSCCAFLISYPRDFHHHCLHFTQSISQKNTQETHHVQPLIITAILQMQKTSSITIDGSSFSLNRHLIYYSAISTKSRIRGYKRLRHKLTFIDPVVHFILALTGNMSHYHVTPFLNVAAPLWNFDTSWRYDDFLWRYRPGDRRYSTTVMTQPTLKAKSVLARRISVVRRP